MLLEPDKTLRARASRKKSAARYHAAHAETYRARSKAWAAANPEKVRAYHAIYQEENAEALDAYQAEYRATHRAERAATAAAWRKANPDKAVAQAQRHRALKLNAPINDFTDDQWQEIKAAFGHRCAYQASPGCKGRTMKNLTQDHLTALANGGSHTASNIVPACRSCNAKKGAGAVLVPTQPLLLTLAPSKPSTRKQPDAD